MDRPSLNRRTIPLWADLVLVVISLCCTTHMMQDTADGLSFGGFFVLFMLVVLGIYFLALIGSLFLLPLSIRSGKVRYAAIAAVLHILTPIPWLKLVRAFEYPFSWFEILMIVGMIAGAVVLVSLPITKLSGKSRR